MTFLKRDSAVGVSAWVI